MTMLRIATVLASVLAAAASATAPKQHTVTKTTAVGHSFDATWSALIDVFADHNWAVDNMEKDSGLITTDWMNLGDGDMRYVDCGSEGMYAISGTQVRFNVRVKGDESGATITVNTKFRQDRMFDGRHSIVDCNSTGVVEPQIQAEVAEVAGRGAKRKAKKATPVAPVPTAAPTRGFYCSAGATTGFCVRDKAECARTRSIAIGNVPDLSECVLTESAWCAGDVCTPTQDGCAAGSDCERRE